MLDQCFVQTLIISNPALKPGNLLDLLVSNKKKILKEFKFFDQLLFVCAMQREKQIEMATID